MEEGDKTPPNQPTYGVHLTDSTITKIIQKSLRACSAIPQISRLPSGKSFNNRIYTIELEAQQSYILKVNGRFFGAPKVENEVSCLLLLNHYCPDLPVPRVISWSREGLDVSRRGDDGQITATTLDHAEAESIPGWILMTCRPGEILDASKLSADARADICSQLADAMVSWRQNIPRSASCASLHFRPYNADTASRSLYLPKSVTGLELHVYGFADYDNYFCPPVDSLLGYYQTELAYHINKLSTNPVFAPNRETLLPLLNTFMKNTLPKLPLLLNDTSKAAFPFLHGDLFPRNILISPLPSPKVTGIVDFEFSGFYPPMDEFMQTWIPDEDGSEWPADMYDMLLDELERRGEPTPRLMREEEWVQCKMLGKLRNWIAPWWIAEGGEEGEGLEKQLREARGEVVEAVETLEALVGRAA